MMAISESSKPKDLYRHREFGLLMKTSSQVLEGWFRAIPEGVILKKHTG